MSNIDVTRLSTRELASEYNAAARYLGEREINKFADRATAERRTIAIMALAEEARKQGENVTIDRTQPVSVQAASAIQVNDSGTELVNTGPDHFRLRLSEEDRASIAEEAGERASTVETRETPTQAPVSAPPASSGRERWRRPKSEAPSKVAWLPRDNTVQRFMYDLLTRDGGIPITEFCARMAAAGYKDKSWLSPPGVWSGLRYIFVDQGGYGLTFDGNRLELLRPADERIRVKKGS